MVFSNVVIVKVLDNVKSAMARQDATLAMLLENAIVAELAYVLHVKVMANAQNVKAKEFASSAKELEKSNVDYVAALVKDKSTDYRLNTA